MITACHRILLAIFMTSGLFAQSGNLIINGDFETVENDAPAGWIIAPYGSKNTVLTSAAEGDIRGKASAHLKHERASAETGTKAIVLITKAKVNGIIAGTEYRFRFAARAPVKDQQLRVYYYTDTSISPHYYKMKTITVSDAWDEYEFVLKLPLAEDWKDRALFMRFDIPYGEVYLDDVVLAPNTDAPATEKKSAYASLNRRNLFQNSSFEIGFEEYALTRGLYMRGRDANNNEPRQPVLDTAEKMHGNASLRLDNPDGDAMLFSSRDIHITPGKEYTLSGWFKTDGGIKVVSLSILSIISSGARKNATTWSEVGGEWKRMSVTFTAAPNHEYYTLQIGNIAEGYGKQPPPTRNQAGTMWIDGIQLTEGKSSKYEPDDFEIGLALTTNRYYAYTPDEPYMVSFRALNNTSSDTEVKFRYTIEDCYFNKTVRTGETAVMTLAGNSTGTIAAEINPKRYGLFVLNYELVNAKTGVVLDAYSFDYAVIGNIMAAPAPKGFTTGGQMNFRANWFAQSWATQPTLVYYGATIDETYDFIANVGDRWFRCWDFGWGHNEVNEGNYEWQVLDRQIEELTKRGMRIVASFDTLIVDEKNPQSIYAHVPKWAQERYGVTDTKGTMKCRVSVPPVEIWARYFTECVKRYKGKVRAYEIFNEPNLWLSPELYTQYLKTACSIVRANDPDAKVIGFCATGDLGGNLLKFVKECMNLGANDYFDAMSFHPYDSRLDSSSYPAEKAIAGIKQLLTDVGAGKKDIWNSELFYLEDDLPEYFYGSHDVKGHQFARRLLIDQFHGVARSACLDGGYNRARIAPLALDLPRKPIPSRFYVINNAWARFFEGGKPAKQVSLTGKNKLYIYDRPDGPVAAYWNYSYAKKSTAVLALRNAKEKIILFDLMGNPLEKPVLKDNGYLLTESADPVYIRPNGISRDEFLKLMDSAEMEYQVPVSITARMAYREDKPVIAAELMNYAAEVTPVRLSFKASSDAVSASPVTVQAKPRDATPVVFPLQFDKPWTATELSFNAEAGTKQYDLAPVSVRYRPFVTASRVEKAPVIDGIVKSDEWNTRDRITLDSLANLRNAVPAVWGGANDMSGRVMLSWDNNALYLGFKVLDDKRGERNDRLGVWNSDCIELFIDTAADDAPTATGFNSRCCQLVIGMPTVKFPEVVMFKASGMLEMNTANLAVKTSVQPGGYDVELAIPWKELGGITPAAGMQLGFDVCLSDNDATARKLSLVWSGADDYYRNRLNFGRVLLSR
ncbi:MAG: hypothetical protein HZC28_17120 [Spirochaetes bacterium]|nr:hypothetical protein [Spirochaetota bacterium]